MTRRGEGGGYPPAFLHTHTLGRVPVAGARGTRSGWATGATRVRAPAPLSNYHCRRHRRGWGRKRRSNAHAHAPRTARSVAAGSDDCSGPRFCSAGTERARPQYRSRRASRRTVSRRLAATPRIHTTSRAARSRRRRRRRLHIPSLSGFDENRKHYNI